jgi:hypothetical protein
MIGCAEFILGYDFTFEYLRRTYGDEAVVRYWQEAISVDSQRHARELIVPNGFDGMEEYWGHTLAEEEAGYTSARTEGVFRMDMYACPSQGLLKERGQEHFADYCEHCMGWIEPVLREAGFVTHHEHNHNCMCWWEIVPRGPGHPGPAAPSQPGELAGEDDIRLKPGWDTGRIDRYVSSRRTS